MNRTLKKLSGFLAALLCIVLLCSSVAFATDINTAQGGEITLSYPVEGVEFRLYRVAEVDARGKLALVDPYSGYGLTFEQENTDSWNDLAVTLSTYIRRDGLQATAQGTTEAGGTLTLKELQTGLYLVDWDSHTTEGKKYIPQPFLVTLPILGEDGDWSYTVTPVVKYTTEEDVPQTASIHVHKVWADNSDSAKARPAAIRVQLLQNGKVYETVTLDRDNSWSYNWTGLESGFDWTVAEEEVPAGYTVSITREGASFLITNTRPNTPTTPPTTPPKLPQTGMTWWPVPLLAAFGLFCVILGWGLKQRRNEE